MPMYEYKCAKCGEVFELIQKFSDEPLHEHPGCGGEVERLVSAPALQFKGSGWYVNDYGRNGSAGNSSSKDSSGKEKSKAESSDTKKSDKAETSTPAATPAKETTKST